MSVMLSAALFITLLPISVDPVNASFRIPLWFESGSPASGPNPVTMLTTPSGITSSASSISFSTDSGVSSAGLSTTALPADSAGPSFQAAINNGKFHGMIWPTTP